MGGVNISPTTRTLSSLAYTTASSGDIAAVPAVAGQIIRVYRLLLVIGGTTNITFKDGTTALTGALPFVVNNQLLLPFDGEPWFTTSQSGQFTINGSQAVQVSGIVYFTQGIL